MPEFKEYRQNADGPVTRAAVLTDSEAGPYVIQGFTGETYVGPGAVLVETARPGVYDMVSAKDWEAMEMRDGDFPVADIGVLDTGKNVPADEDDI